MKFDRKKVQGIMHTEVRFTLDKSPYENEPFEVVALPLGVYVSGRSPVFTGHAELQTFAKAIGDAMKDYLELKKTLIHVPPEGGIQ